MELMRFFLKFLFFIHPTFLTLGTILVVVIFLLYGIPIFDSVELKTYDLRFLSRGQLSPSPAVVMVLVDEKSLDTEGPGPGPGPGLLPWWTLCLTMGPE